MVDIIYGYIGCLVIGVVLGLYIFLNWKNNRLDKNRRIPLVGALMMEDPTKRKYDKNKIADMVLACVFTFICMDISWVFLPMLVILITHGVFEER
jgi:hypothetical protein